MHIVYAERKSTLTFLTSKNNLDKETVSGITRLEWNEVMGVPLHYMVVTITAYSKSVERNASDGFAVFDLAHSRVT